MAQAASSALVAIEALSPIRDLFCMLNILILL